MITFLAGKLFDSLPTQVIIEVNGLGYEVLIPLSSFDKLPAPGHPVHLLTHLVVREDAHVLYGFMTAAERELFRMLINTVSGIGPKTALNVLSGMNVVAFRGAVANGDVKALAKISGVGKKTAERIVVELRDKVGPAGAWEASSAQRVKHLFDSEPLQPGPQHRPFLLHESASLAAEQNIAYAFAQHEPFTSVPLGEAFTCELLVRLRNRKRIDVAIMRELPY